MPKKKFIEKKNSVTFRLVNRSLRDPLAVDETAPQKVLVPVNDKPNNKQTDDENGSFKKRKDEQRKYGIYFDDDYNYLQHLRNVDRVTTEWEPVENPPESKINLPSSVFESEVEEKESFLNNSTPSLSVQLQTYDPDVVVTLDDDFAHKRALAIPDNFFQLANGECDQEEFEENEEFKKYEVYDDAGSEFDFGDIDESTCNYEEMDSTCKFDEEEKGTSDDDDDDDDDEEEMDGSLPSLCNFDKEETKSRFTEYSMSSSVMKRNDQLTLLDDKFENMYICYDDNEIGALDSEEIEGFLGLDSDHLLKTSKEFEEQELDDAEDTKKIIKERLKQANTEYVLSDEDDDDTLEKMIVEAPKDKNWDCESILSTYSNIYNHPKLISESKGSKIEINDKTGYPKNVLSWQNSNKLTLRNLAILGLTSDSKKTNGPASIKSTISTLSYRPKNETLEEKKERKKAVKNLRKERRIERKANINAFKEEKSRQEKMLLNKAKANQGRIL